MPNPAAPGAIPEARLSASLADPRRRYSPSWFRGFVRYLRWYVGRHFHGVLVSLAALPRPPAGKPLIIYSNHPSWWDPLLFVLVGEALFPGRRGYGPMEAKSLKRYAILERMGAFGIELETARGGVEFMVQAKRILADASSILWLTAEGAFTDVRARPVAIRKGLGYLVRMTPGVIVLPLAVEYPFWNESRPVAVCRFGEPIDIDALAPRSAPEWNAVFEDALTHSMDALALESIQRNPARFRSLLSGTAGVGGIYDGWRRVRAWSRGRRFDASHEQQK